jgi:hypothetical protein
MRVPLQGPILAHSAWALSCRRRQFCPGWAYLCSLVFESLLDIRCGNHAL